MATESRPTGVAVVVPAYNPGPLLESALGSALRQTYEHIEVVVVDDGSDDGRDYAAVCDIDRRVRYIRQRNGGPSVARNTGILATQAPYLAFLDADDLWGEAKLAAQVALMEANPDSPLCYTDFSRGTSPGRMTSTLAGYRPRQPAREFEDLLRENFVCTSTVLVRRSALARAGLFDPGLRGSEDFDLWLRLAANGAFVFLDSVLVFKRNHPGNISSTLTMAREQRKLFRLLLQRWGHDPVLRTTLCGRLSDCCQNLAYAERVRGNFREARAAYIESARLGERTTKSLLIAGLLTLPPWILRRMPRISGGGDPLPMGERIEPR